MYVSSKKIDSAINVFKEHNGLMRYHEAIEMGLYDRILYEMRDLGIIVQLERGLYQLVDETELSYPDLVLVQKKVPMSRICLLSALSYHELTDEIPHQVHIAIQTQRRSPTLEYPPLKVYRFSSSTFNAGVGTYTHEGHQLSIYTPAKTVADCFKFRNKIGLSIAIEALKRTLQMRKASIQEILEFALLCRVESIIQPYLETIVHD